MVKHTEGPWTVGTGSNTARDHAVCAGPIILANVIGNGYPIGTGWSEQSEADARLMAKSPEIHAMLVEALDERWLDCTVNGMDFVEWFSKWRERAKELIGSPTADVSR